MIADWWDWEICKVNGRISICRQYWRQYSRPRVFRVEKYAADTLGMDGVE